MPATTDPAATRTRVSAYQARIERTLTDVFIDVPRHNQAGQEWVLVNVAHTNGFAQCELCGHVPIKRLFFIESTTTQVTKMIGSECARNYLRVDLVEAYERTLNRQQNRLRTQRRRDEERARRQAEYEARLAARRASNATWATEHAAQVEWLRANATGDSFLSSLLASFEQYNRLTDRQLEVVVDRMNRAANPRPQNAADRAATPDQVPHIYNGTYTMDNGSRHLTFQIYTATRGPLQGKRIVKRSMLYGQFQGFAFVGADGTLQVWRRFQEQSTELYMEWARELLACLNSRGNDAPGIDTLTHTSTAGTFTIQRTRSCRRCNRTLTVPTSIESGIGPECARRNPSENRTVVADAHAGGTGAVAPPPVPRRTARTQAGLYAAPARRAAVPAQALALSELGTGMVQ